jgi:predicted nuclease with RNAse H fold
MITLGIDLSSMPKSTVACLLEWTSERVKATLPILQCSDVKLDELIEQADVVGIDAPFGWPKPFMEAVSSWKLETWSAKERITLQFRETDLQVQRQTGIWPLSVSSDRIALPAMRAMALLNRHGVTDRSGDGKFFEVYPAGSLSCWNLQYRGYKRLDQECGRLRQHILRKLRLRMPWLEVPESYADSPDALDALIASLTVRSAVQRLTRHPDESQLAIVRVEGWIHLPIDFPKIN